MRFYPAGIAALLIATSAVSGCGKNQQANTPKIRYGQDTCNSCRMIISEPSFAAAYRLISGEWRLFDDIGCLLKALKQEVVPPEKVLVHDYESGAWTDAATATFVVSRQLVTPMGYGFAAFIAASTAETFARAQSGEIKSFAVITSQEGSQ